jgi:ABC-type ATPase involved in cell division
VLGRAVVLHQRFAGHPARHQPRQLGAAVAAQTLQVGQYRAFVGPPQLAVAQAPQHRLDPAVASFVILRCAKLQLLRALQHLPHLLHGAHLRFVHVDHH